MIITSLGQTELGQKIAESLVYVEDDVVCLLIAKNNTQAIVPRSTPRTMGTAGDVASPFAQNAK